METTSDNLTGRGGLALFVKYLSGVGIYSLLDENFGKMRKSMKGQAIQPSQPKLLRRSRLWNIFKQRGLKEFGSEELPFKRFAANSAFYYCMVISFFLFETYKEDVLQGIVPITSYATTIRRQVVDWAAKIIRRGRQIILKVTQVVMVTWHVDKLLEIIHERPLTPIRSNGMG